MRLVDAPFDRFLGERQPMGMLTHRSKVLGLAAAALLGSACGPMEGNGVLASEERSLPAFSRLKVENGLLAELSPAGERAAWVSGDENLLSQVSLKVEEDVLVVKLEPGGWAHSLNPLRVVLLGARPVAAEASGGARVEGEVVRTDSLEISASGGSRVALSGVDAERLTVDDSGGSEVRLAGVATAARLEVSGGASYAGRELQVQQLEVDGSGGSRLEARACCSVKGELSGGASLRLVGRPTRQDLRLTGGARLELE